MKESVGLHSLREALSFDPEAVLVREGAVLMNAEFLSALQAELLAELGASEAPTALLQIGFLHGLRDALQVVAEGSREPGDEPLLHAPALPIRFRTNPDAQPRGAIEIHGAWPERLEAESRLALAGSTTSPACALSAGYTSGWLSAILEADVLAVETTCAATGDDACRFEAREASVWRRHPDDAAARALAAVPFDAMRELVARHAASLASAAGMDSQEPVVHIWGPVMVIPFSGADEALAALDLLGRDPEAARVSVIVIDVTGTILDEAFGASALERILESVEHWGADAILAGVSPLSQPVVAGLAHQPLMIHKDLHAAIAAAFQMADSQRHTT